MRNYLVNLGINSDIDRTSRNQIEFPAIYQSKGLRRTVLERQSSIMPLALFRIGFGLLMLLSTIRFAANGWIHSLYIEPVFHFTYYGFSWVKPLPEPWIYLAFGLMGLAALSIALGLFYRFSIVSFFLLFTYVELLDKATYLNHYYLVSVLAFLCIWLPLNGALSVDAYRNSAIQRTTVPRWMRDLLCIQISLVYIYAGLAKVQPDWLLNAMPMKIWLMARTDLPVVGSLFATEWMPYLMSWGGAIYDMTIPFFLFYRPTRIYAFVAVVGFHLATAFLFPPIGIFPYLMIIAAVLFFQRGDVSSGFDGTIIPKQNQDRRKEESRLPIALCALFVLIQLVLPLRHYLYPGDVLWTEEGFRYSWKVMIVEKTGQTIFMVTNPATDQAWPLYPDVYLTPLQNSQMAYQPDMILEFAHFVQDEMARRGISDVAVRAESYVSYNGRPSQLLIDPNVDLTQSQRSLWPQPWIMR